MKVSSAEVFLPAIPIGQTCAFWKQFRSSVPIGGAGKRVARGRIEMVPEVGIEPTRGVNPTGF